MDATALSDFARRTAESVSDFASVIHNLIMDVRDSYRPGLHYMRGPGPKWRAKHQPWLGVDPQPYRRPGSASCRRWIYAAATRLAPPDSQAEVTKSSS
jgi:hypothetical protein